LGDAKNRFAFGVNAPLEPSQGIIFYLLTDEVDDLQQMQ